jgi:glycosyltransferase involved in cell wall biosynthesis
MRNVILSIQLSIILPCYNEADNLPLLLQAYHSVWEELPAELILVDNGSGDDTARVLAQELQRPELAFAQSVRVEQNKGYGDGIFTGLRLARGEFLAYSHADMQCNPADVFTAYHKLVAQPDPTRALVKGQRSRRSFSALLLTQGMALLASTLLMTYLTDINAQPKVFHRSLMWQLVHPPAGFQFDLYVLYRARRAGLEILTVPVVFGERPHGKSKWAANIFSRYRTIWAMITYIFRLRFGVTP